MVTHLRIRILLGRSYKSISWVLLETELPNRGHLSVGHAKTLQNRSWFHCQINYASSVIDDSRCFLSVRFGLDPMVDMDPDPPLIKCMYLDLGPRLINNLIGPEPNSISHAMGQIVSMVDPDGGTQSQTLLNACT